MLHVTFYYWHRHKIQSHQFDNPFFGAHARPFHFHRWVRVCAVKIGASYFGNLFTTCQRVLGHTCHIWYSLGLKSLTHNHSTRAGPVRICYVTTGMFDRKWKAARVSRSIGNFFNGLKMYLQIVITDYTHDFLMCNIIKMMLRYGCSQMLHISFKTEKSFISHSWCLQSVVGLGCIHWGWSAAPARWGQGQLLGVSEAYG